MEIIEKISETEFKVITEKIVDLDKIREQINEFKNQLNKPVLVKYPEGCSQEVKMAIDSYNEPNIALQVMTQQQIDILTEELLKYI